jgi:hypothetical protein
VIQKSQDRTRPSRIGKKSEIEGPKVVPRHRLRPAVFDLPAEPEDFFPTSAKYGSDEGLAHGLTAPLVALVEDLGYFAAAVIGKEGLEPQDLPAHPFRLWGSEDE